MLHSPKNGASPLESCEPAPRSKGDAPCAAIDFLEKLRPGGPWVLTAIVPDGKTITITAKTHEDVEGFIREHDGKQNLYYSVNPTRTVMSKKAAKTDIAAIEYALADLDPADGETSEQAKARYLTQLENGFDPKPTGVIDSGNGIQVLWQLEDRIVLGKPIWIKDAKGKDKLAFTPEDQAKIDDVEARVASVMLRLGSKAGTQNIDRILRLPGTTNLPNKKKLKEGRTACPTKLISFNSAVHPLTAFPPPSADDATSKDTSTDDSAQTFDTSEIIAPNDSRLAGLDQRWIALGHEGTGIAEEYGGDRSRAVFAFACQCIRAGIADDVTASCLMHWKIGEHIRDQANVDRALRRTLTRARQCIKDSKLFEMNEKHGVLPIGGKTRVATWGDDPDFPGRQTIVRSSSLADFKALQNKYRHTYRNDGGEIETVLLGNWWIGHPHRRQHDGGMRFMPARDEDVVGDTLNLWQGLAVPARKPEGKSGAAGCKLFLDHGLKIICSGNEAHFDYLMKREALIAQQRVRSEVALGLHTPEEGTGKGVWCRSLNRLYGPHAMQVLRADHVIGKHNKHLEVLLRLTADEALFVGDPRHRNALYGLITEETNTIEPKNIDAYSVPNFVNIDIISNAEHFIPASGTARRFFVPTVSPERASDHEYFRKILAELNDGGYEALLYHLLYEIDIRDFNVRAVPKTAALAEQAAYSRKGVDLLVEIACNEGVVPCQHNEYPNVSVTAGRDRYPGFDFYIEHHKELAYLGPQTVKRRLKKEWGCVTGKEARRQKDGKQVGGIVWPSLADLRSRFEKKHGPQEWQRDDVEEWNNEHPLRDSIDSLF
jgi:hypothetical protein